ncbi:MAG: hypothetical protein MZW92_46600 [Comamonadaceae bacterium]|nr:hypothetical protein [Comamonadaceae bacterium]
MKVARRARRQHRVPGHGGLRPRGARSCPARPASRPPAIPASRRRRRPGYSPLIELPDGTIRNAPARRQRAAARRSKVVAIDYAASHRAAAGDRRRRRAARS